MTFEDVAVYFNEEELALLGPDERSLHRAIMEENFWNVASVGKFLFPFLAVHVHVESVRGKVDTVCGPLLSPSSSGPTGFRLVFS